MPGMGPFEQGVRDLMRKYNIPGGAVALVRDGRLIYARGFGYADVENRTPAFRLSPGTVPVIVNVYPPDPPEAVNACE